MKAALIGVGYWGKNYLRLLSEDPTLELLYVADVSPDAISKVEVGEGTLKTSNLDDIFNSRDVDFVVVTTPASTHYDIVKHALMSGKSVLVEKPLTLSSKEATELINLAEDSGLILLTGHTYLYNDAYRFLKNYLDSGKLGELLYVYGVRMGLGPIRNDASCLWDLAVHDISMALDLTGKIPEKYSIISSSFINSKKSITDFASVGLLYSSGPTFSFTVSWYSPSKVREWKLVGSKAMVTFNDMNKEYPVTINEISVNSDAERMALEGYYRVGDMSQPRINAREPLKVLIEHFLELIKKGESFRDELAVKVVTLIENLEKGS